MDVTDLKIKVSTLAVKVSIAASLAMIVVDVVFRFLFK